jgi:hypothetical protein
VKLVPTRKSLIGSGLVLSCAAVFGAAVVLVGFESEPLSVLGGTAIGAAVFGVVAWITQVSPQVPGSRDVPELPPDAELERPYGFNPRRLPVALGLIVGAAWLEDRWGAGAAFIPGALVGSAAANLLGAALVARWERAHGLRVVNSEQRDREDTELFAQQPPLISG